MLIEKKPQIDTVASRILTRARDYGLSNPKGEVFDNVFLKSSVEQEVEKSRNIIGQGKSQLLYPNGSGCRNDIRRE